MPYGRLDVYWPDGPVETYTLSKRITAIGRSPGNDIVLDTTSISRYHISLTYRDEQIILEDLESVNGTYIDGERVHAHEPRLLHGGEEVQIGDIRMIFRPEGDLPTRPNRFPEETQKIEIQQPDFSIALQPPDMPVTPGTSVQGTLIVRNLSTQTERYFIEVTGVPKAWIRVERSEIELSPTQETEVALTFKPLRRSDSAPGDYPVVVRVRPKAAPDQAIEAPMKLKMLSFTGFGVALGTPRLTNGGMFELYLHNQGSAPLPLLISGRSAGNALVFSFNPPGVTLHPGERGTIRGRISTRNHAIVGAAREKTFDLLVLSQDNSHFLTAVSGTLDINPVLPVWAQGASLMGVIAFSLFALVVIGLLLLWVTRPVTTAPPVVTPGTATPVAVILKVNSFAVKPNPVLRNVRQSVVLTWSVTGAEAIRFRGIDALTGSSDSGSYSGTDTLTLAGVVPRDAVDLTLLATGPNESSITQTLHVEIANPKCQTTRDQMAYAGPSDSYPTVKEIPANQVIEVDGQSPTGTWLHRIPAPDPQIWLPVTVLLCPDFAFPDLTVISDIPALPTTTLTPTTPATSTVVTSTKAPAAATIEGTPTPIIVPSITPTGEVLIGNFLS